MLAAGVAATRVGGGAGVASVHGQLGPPSKP